MRKTTVTTIFHSLVGHSCKLANAIAEGASSVSGVTTKVLQVKETLSEDVLEDMGAVEFKESTKDIPIATSDDLAEADALAFGCGTRFGSASAQMQGLCDQTGSLWQEGKLVGKVGSVFCSTGGSPYGAATIASAGGSRSPSDNEWELARAQGRYVAETANKLNA